MKTLILIFFVSGTLTLNAQKHTLTKTWETDTIVAVPESVTCKANQGSEISVKASPDSEMDLPTQRRPNAG